MITELRAGLAVKRFHTSNRIESETVGHHSANVCAILLRLNPECSRQVLVAALMHDVAEAYTGDVPAPFKWENPEAKLALEEGEQDFMAKYDVPYPTHLTEEERQLLKLADMLDLVLSSLEELGRGNQYARKLIENGQDYIMNMGLSTELLLKAQDMVLEVKAQWQQTISK